MRSRGKKSWVFGGILILAAAFGPYGGFGMASSAENSPPQTLAQTPVPTRSESTSESQADAEEESRFVLTRLGLVQEGIPVDRGETLFLRMKGSKGGFTISKLDVVFIGKTREEVFDFQRKKLVPGDLAGILTLAEWSARNQLAPEGIALLKATRTLTEDPAVQEELTKKIEQMEYVERLKNEALAKMNATKERGPSPAETSEDPEKAHREAFAQKVPTSVQDRYTRKIQPILLKRCGMDGCHQAESDSVFTLSDPLGGGSRRQANLRNLETVFQWIDPADPTQSPILNHPPIADAANTRVYPFGEDANSLKDYETFVGWLGSLAGKIDGVPITPRPQSAPNRMKDAASDGDTGESGNGSGAAYYGPGSQYGMTEAEWNEFNRAADSNPDGPTNEGEDAGTAGLSANIATAGIEKSDALRRSDPNNADETLRRAGFIPKNPPKDEFDPAPFNRKYHAESPDKERGSH